MRKFGQSKLNNSAKTHFKMYKTNKGWMVAGISTVLFGVGVMQSQAVAADTGEPSDQSALIGEQGDKAGSASSEHEATPQVDHGVPSDAQAATNTTDSHAEDDVDVSTTTQQNDSDEEHSSDDGSTVSSQAPEAAAAANQTTVGSDATLVQAKPDSATSTSNTPSATSRALRATDDTDAGIQTANDTETPVAETGTATATINGKSELTKSYQGVTSPNPADGSKNDETIAVSASNLVKGNVLTVAVPNFMQIFSTVPINNTTMQLNSTNTAVTYTATSDLPTLVQFDVHMKAVTPKEPGTSQTGEVQVAVSNLTDDTVHSVAAPVNATYSVADLGKGSPSLLTFVNQSNVLKNIQTNQDFLSRIYVFNTEKLAPADVKGYNYTIPVPAGYQLDPVASMAITQQHDPNNVKGWSFSQNGVGSEIVVSLDPTQVTDRAVTPLLNFAWLVGKMTGAASGLQTAAQAATATISTVYGDSTAVFPKFAVNVAADGTDALKLLANSNSVYVGPTDVNQFNIMTSDSLGVLTNTNDLINPQLAFTVPTGTKTTGLQLKMDDIVRAMGETATMTAFDAAGNQIGTIDTTNLLPDASNNYIWVPINVGAVASYKVTFNHLVNGSFGQTAVNPMLTVDQAVNGTKKIAIPTVMSADNMTAVQPDYFVNATSSHLLTGFTNPHLDADRNNNVYFQPGDIASSGRAKASTTPDSTYATVGYYPFDRDGISTYNMLDDEAVLYIPIPNDTTFQSTTRQNVNATALRAGTQNYVRLVIPAGTPVTSSANPKYNLPDNTSYVNRGKINTKINDDVTPLSHIAMPDAKQAPLFLGLNNNQLDTTNGWRTWTLAEIRDLGYDEIADQLAQAGYTGAYSESSAYRNATLIGGKQWPISMATSVTLGTQIKGGAEQQYVSGDGSKGVATFYPATGAETGAIRVYVGNGTDSPLQQYTGLINLPKSEDGAAYSLNLQGQVTAPANYQVKYSTEVIAGTDGQALTPEQLAKFVDGTGGALDYAAVKSILITTADVARGDQQQIVIPVVANGATAGTSANATAFNYAMNGANVVGAQNIQLPTRAADPQQQITVNYLTNDAAHTPISMATTIVADAGSTLNLTAAIVTGYKVDGPATVAIPVTKALTDYNFYYNPDAVKATLYFNNALTSAAIKSPVTISGLIGSTADLTPYASVTGYTASANNPAAYTFTNALVQPVTLYYTPTSTQLTINYQDANHTDLIAPKSLGVLVGSSYKLTPAEIPGYKSTVSGPQDYKVAAENQTYTFNYKREAPVPVTIKYVLGAVDTGTIIKDGEVVSVPTGETKDFAAPQTITLDGNTQPDYQLAAGENADYTAAPEFGQTTPLMHVFHYDKLFYDTVTRTINYVDAAGNQMKDSSGTPLEPTVQQVTFKGVGQDEDAANATWSGPQQFAEVAPNPFVGYTAVTKVVLAQKVVANQNNVILQVTYVPNQVQLTTRYITVDANGNARDIASPTHQNTGYGTTVNLNAPSIAGFTLTARQPSNLQKQAGIDGTSFAFVYDYATGQLDIPPIHFTKEIDRTIVYQYADGSKPVDGAGNVLDDVTQHATLTGLGPNLDDAVWATAEFPTVSVPTVPGATADMAVVPAQSLTGADDSSTVLVTYTPNQSAGGGATGIDTTTDTSNDTPAGGNPVTGTDDGLPDTNGGATDVDENTTGTSNIETGANQTNQAHGQLPNTLDGQRNTDEGVSDNARTEGHLADRHLAADTFRHGRNGKQASLPQTGAGDASKSGLIGLVMLVLSSIGAFLPNRRKND